jgi:hypothetical protein
MLRQAGRPITTGECALAFAREVGLEQDDAHYWKYRRRVITLYYLFGLVIVEYFTEH